MTKNANRLDRLSLLTAFLGLSVTLSCTVNDIDPNIGGSDVGDSDSTSDSDVSTDSEGNIDAGADAGADSDTDWTCDAYPVADGNFSTGSVISNYVLIDKDDKKTEICELAKGKSLMLIKISVDNCMGCQLEILDIIDVATLYEPYGVIIIEAQQAISSQEALLDWVQDHDYYGFRTYPPKQIKYDYMKTEQLPFFGAMVLIDPTTMKVLEPDCGLKIWDAEDRCLSQYLNKADPMSGQK
ncbi:MAG: hypothetical protein QNJ97_11310 [Myxococcota bacterium]|nr:hypothetical protein [Myxococcota bacterium]